MKRIFFSLLIGLIALAGYAQNSEEDVLPSDRNHMTVSVSYDVSIPGKWKTAAGSVKMFKPGGGVSVGLDYMWIFDNNVFFEPGARLFFDSYKYDNVTIGTGSPTEAPRTYDPSVWKSGLHLPLTAGYKFDVFQRGSLFFSTGPEPIFGFTAKTKVDDDKAEYFEQDMYKTVMRRFDIAWDVRAAIIIDRFRIDLTCAFGMLNVMKNDLSMHEHRFSVGLGYVF